MFEREVGEAQPELEPVAELAEVDEIVVIEAVEGNGEPERTEAAPDDAEGARLIALNMALNGTPREETDRYLSENFQLSDRDGLLDEVYASVEG
jgi:hypothetical protein